MKAQDIRYLVIHCSATRCNRPYSLAQMDRDHRARGFAGIGYHYYIRLNGDICALRGRDEVGAHVRGYNRISLGICYEGGLNERGHAEDTRTPEQKASLIKLLKWLHGFYPQAKIVGHRDLSPDKNGDGKIDAHEWVKLCPCFDASREYAYIEEGQKEVCDDK